MTAEPYKSFLKNIYRHIEWYLLISTCTIFKLSWRPIVRLFDGLTDRMEKRRENRAVGAHNQTIGCDFEESEGLWHVRLDRMNRIWLFISITARNALLENYYKNCKQYPIGWTVGPKIWMEFKQYESHQIMSVNTNAIKLFKIGQKSYFLFHLTYLIFLGILCYINVSILY